MRPRLSVIMPVYNAGKYLAQAMRSILSQRHDSFELIVIDDASTDSSWETIRSFDDPRVRAFRNPENLRLAATLNRGIDLAHGDLLARMDSDDVAHPERLARQERFMGQHPEIGASGSWVRVFGARYRFLYAYPTDAVTVAAFALFDSPVCHPAVIIRRGVLARHGLRFDPEFNPAEDFDLWERLLRVSRMMNMPEALLDYRVHASSMTRSDWPLMDARSSVIVKRQFRARGIALSQEAIRFHRRVSTGAGLTGVQEVIRAESWLGGLTANEALLSHYSRGGLEGAVGLVWFRACLNAMRHGPGVWSLYRRSPLRRLHQPFRRERVAMLSRAVLGLFVKRAPGAGR